MALLHPHDARLAVLIDTDNASVSHLEALLSEIADRGALHARPGPASASPPPPQPWPSAAP